MTTEPTDEQRISDLLADNKLRDQIDELLGYDPEFTRLTMMGGLTLDGMAAARKTLTPEERETYGHELRMAVEPEGKVSGGNLSYAIADASARQHGLAFLRAKGVL